MTVKAQQPNPQIISAKVTMLIAELSMYAISDPVIKDTIAKLVEARQAEVRILKNLVK